MPHLTPAQTTALSVLEWLFDPESRRQGRTVAQAIALIRLAVRNPGIPFELRDFAGRAADPELVRTVTGLVGEDQYLSSHCEWALLGQQPRQPILRFRVETLIDPSWLPRDWTVDTHPLRAEEFLVRPLPGGLGSPNHSEPPSPPRRDERVGRREQQREIQFQREQRVALGQRNHRRTEEEEVDVPTRPPEPSKPQARTLWERLEGFSDKGGDEPVDL